MNIILEGIDPTVKTRKHPYDGAAYDKRVKHYNFVTQPELIRKRLEDFIPWSHHKSVDEFYQFLEWLNGNGSIFESSDCRLEPPTANPHSNVPFKMVLQGRVMILFRDIGLNYAQILPEDRYLVGQQLTDLINGLYRYLGETFDEIWWVTIQLFLFPISYRKDGKHSGIFGHQVTVQFTCFADDEAGLFAGFSWPVRAIFQALEAANSEWKAADTRREQ